MNVSALAVKPKPLMQITKKQTDLHAGPVDIQALRDEFSRKHCIWFPRFLGKALLREIQAQVLSGSRYYKKSHKGLALELCMRENAVSRLIHFFINDEKIFQFVESVTGLKPIGCFHGRVYRMVPGEGHYHVWHSDWTHHRLLGLSINLSERAYKGGALQMRTLPKKKQCHEIFNTGFGDMILFRLGEKLEHRVTDVTGTVEKVAFAGWFSSRPKYLACLKNVTRPKRKK